MDRPSALAAAEHGKSLTAAALGYLMENYNAARSRAIDLDKKHEGDGSPPGENPSSSVLRIVDSIRGVVTF